MKKEIFLSKAINLALNKCLEINNGVFIIGEDICTKGGAFGVTKGLVEKYGCGRLYDMPISENSFVGMAVGSAMTGLIPVVEIMYIDFIALAMDQILNKISKIKFISNDRYKMPITIRTTAGGGRFYGPDHSQSLEPLLQNIPELIIVAPSNVNDAYHLLIDSVFLDSPVIFIEYRKLYEKRGILDLKKTSDFGKAKIISEGEELSIVSWGRMLDVCLDVKKELLKQKINAEVIDLRFIKPIDIETISKSVKKTGKLVTVEESCLTGGIGAEIVAQIIEKNFYDLDSPPLRIGARDMPIPFSKYLENKVLPDFKKIFLQIESFIKKEKQ